MVRLLPLLGAAALLCQSVIAAPTYVRRSDHEENRDRHDVSNNREQDAYRYNNEYDNRYDNNGYDRDGYDRDGYDREGYNREGYDEEGYNRDGYDERGYNRDGYDREGNRNEYDNQYQYQYEEEEEHETRTRENEEEHETQTYEEEEYETETYEEEYETQTYEAVYETTSVEEQEAYETSTEHETTTVEEQEQHETTTSEYAYPTYGSGSSEWGNDYQDCVAQCQARYNDAPQENQQNNDNTPPPEGTGAVHTILVAPEGAGLRYMPFAVNATVGDVIRYVWTTANDHTATLSSELAICNKSRIAEDRNFVSGVKNGAEGQQIFDVVVQTEEPQFFYCSVAEHCQKGMFGIINPGRSEGTNSIGSQMEQWVQSNPDLQAAYDYMNQNVYGTSAEQWGSDISLDGIPEEAYADVAANIMFTRANFAANPGMLETGLGASTADGSPVTIVSDLNTLLSNANIDPNNEDAPDGTPTGPAPSATDFSGSYGYGNGAISKGASVWVAGLVGIAGWLLI